MTVPKTKTVQLPIKRNSASHVALCMMKVARKPITIQYLRDISSKFKKFGNKELDRLVTLGYATKDGNEYMITSQGISLVYQIVAQNPRVEPTAD